MFPARHSILIAGSSTAGLVEFSCYLASTYLHSDQRVLFIAADVPIDQLRGQFARFDIDASEREDDGELAFIECVSAAAQGDSGGEPKRTCDMKDLETLLRTTDEMLSSLDESFARIVLYSVTPMFMYHDQDSLSIFFETLSLKAKRYGSLTAVIHNDVLTETQVGCIEAVVDGVIDVRVDADFRRYVMIKCIEGLTVKPAWVPIEAIKGEEAGAGAFLKWRRGASDDAD